MEDNLARALAPSRYDVEIVNLGIEKSRIAEAESAGIKSVPALHRTTIRTWAREFKKLISSAGLCVLTIMTCAM